MEIPENLHYGWLAQLSAEHGKNFLEVWAGIFSEATFPPPPPVEHHFGKRYTPEEVLGGQECFVGTAVVAKYLGIDARTVRDWCEANRITHYRPDPNGGNILFKLSEVKEDFEKMKIRSKWR